MAIRAERLEQTNRTCAASLAPLRTLEQEERQLKLAVDARRRREALLQELARQGLQPLSYLNEIESRIPRGTTLTSLAVSDSGLSIAGITQDPDEIACFLRLLQRVYGAGLRLTAWELQADGYYRFQLSGEVPSL
ncbi:MAG TPA: PilN domain-containing protein [Firmicutes bacterium]|nr:PilN domain-containing protein [Bacillota bacterium]